MSSGHLVEMLSQVILSGTIFAGRLGMMTVVVFTSAYLLRSRSYSSVAALGQDCGCAYTQLVATAPFSPLLSPTALHFLPTGCWWVPGKWPDGTPPLRTCSAALGFRSSFSTWPTPFVDGGQRDHANRDRAKRRAARGHSKTTDNGAVLQLQIESPAQVRALLQVPERLWERRATGQCVLPAASEFRELLRVLRP